MTENMKQRLLFYFPLLISLAGLLLLSGLWQRRYQKASYEQVAAFCGTVLGNHPELEEELLASLKEFQEKPAQETLAQAEALFTRYGYESRDFGGSVAGDMSAFTAAAVILTLAVSLMCGSLAAKRKRVRLEGLTCYLEQVNTGAPGTLVQEREDEYSGLQDEIYKTVTNLYATREAALKAKKSYAENLANIAHQLKTPLTAADLSLQLMESNAPNPYIQPVRRQAERLNRLEEALLTLSRIDAGALELKSSAVDVYTVLSLAAENLQELFEETGVRLELPDRGCVEFTGDMEWSMEAVMNLLKNCMEHSPEGGTVFCDYASNPLYTEIQIRDQGPGFDSEDLPHLFERFYRGKNASQNGVGIGLALAQSIFRMQNGSVTARNLPEGGACFEIRIYPRHSGPSHRTVT